MLCNSGNVIALEALQRRVRLDGRSCLEYRDVKITFPGLIGQSLVSFGATSVLCTVSGEVTPPVETRPTEGFYHFHMEIGTLTALGFEPGKPTDQEIFISSTIEHLLRDSGAIETESLCIVSGKYVWSIDVDIIVLEDDGNVLDASALAAIASTMHFRKNQVKIDGEKIEILPLSYYTPGELYIHHIPIFITLALIDDFIIIDPSELEESLACTLISVAVNQFEQICKIQKIGGKEISVEQLERVLQIAKEQFNNIYNKLKESMQRDKDSRQWMLQNVK